MGASIASSLAGNGPCFASPSTRLSSCSMRSVSAPPCSTPKHSFSALLSRSFSPPTGAGCGDTAAGNATAGAAAGGIGCCGGAGSSFSSLATILRVSSSTSCCLKRAPAAGPPCTFVSQQRWPWYARRLATTAFTPSASSERFAPAAPPRTSWILARTARQGPAGSLAGSVSPPKRLETDDTPCSEVSSRPHMIGKHSRDWPRERRTTKRHHSSRRLSRGESGRRANMRARAANEIVGTSILDMIRACTKSWTKSLPSSRRHLSRNTRTACPCTTCSDSE
mmetsp:Transcript_13616/g.27960  ORF Transcript_13616/g.27960 Transcript_13616/m.27960 type:complete len:280 (-) Transcript_13616:2306-3145(-)